jgi:hypothetical protein
MRPCCVLGAVILFLIAGVTCAVANNPIVSDAAAAKSSGVKNVPFSADVITEYDRTLDNGGHIQRESRGKIYRDSQGRMRTDSQGPAAQPGSERSDCRITITDPMQQVVIYLNPKNKTATVLHFGDAGPTPATNAKQSKAPKDVSKIHVAPAAPKLAASQPEVGTPQVPSGQGSAPANASIPSGDSAASSMDAGVLSNASSATIVPLGTKIIEGFSAMGTRMTRTINAGTIGNDRPIVSIIDTWTSAELKTTVLMESDDGQAGHSTMKLVNIVRREPNAALFQIPPDYTLKENASAANASH